MDNNFSDYIRKYNAYDTIMLISKKIKEMYEEKGAYYNETVYLNTGGIQKPQQVLIHAWGLSDIAYFLCYFSNDHRGINPSDIDLIELFNRYTLQCEEDAKVLVEDKSLISLVHGTSQKQFWYQRKSEIYEDINRNIYIFLNCHDNNTDEIDIDKPFNEVFGLGLKEFIFITCSIYAMALQNTIVSNINIEDKLSREYPFLTKVNIDRLIKYYSIDYDHLRKSPIKEDILYVKPIIKTQKGDRICVNVYQMARKCNDGAYWFLRDYYYKHMKTNKFIIEYGVYFERYLEQLLNNFLVKGSYERIPESNKKKMADWYIIYDKYIIIIEQKSSIMSVAAKKEFSNDEDIDKYFSIYQKAFLQLDSTSKAYSKKFEGKIVLKIVVHYEKLYLRALYREKVIENIKDKLSNVDNYFLANICEIERLLYIMNSDIEKAKTIIQEYIDTQSIDIGKGKQLTVLLDKYQVDNKFIKENDIIKKWLYK